MHTASQAAFLLSCCGAAVTLLLQVFEALRSQSDYERLLGSVSGATSKLPALWVTGIAAQMRHNDRVSRCGHGALAYCLHHAPTLCSQVSSSRVSSQ